MPQWSDAALDGYDLYMYRHYRFDTCHLHKATARKTSTWHLCTVLCLHHGASPLGLNPPPGSFGSLARVSTQKDIMKRNIDRQGYETEKDFYRRCHLKLYEMMYDYRIIKFVLSEYMCYMEYESW